MSGFLNQPPYNGLTSMEGTFTFGSSVPVGAIALQGFINERGEFLNTALPVGTIGTSNGNSAVIPHFVDGGGWTTQVVLTNPSDAPSTGKVQFYGQEQSAERPRP